MIIIPTEKRFDWAHTPLVLIVIVIANILIFLGYQSSDTAKIQSSLISYFQNDQMEREWPLFKDYLKNNKEDELAKELDTAFNNKAYTDVAVQLLLRDDFYQHLKLNHSDILAGQAGQRRADISAEINTVSYLALGLIPSKMSPLTVISHQFLHGDVMHLLGNLFFLIICGFAVEAAIGHLRFLLFYLIAGIAGGVAHGYFSSNQYAPLVGASGSISGVMAMYASLFWLKRIEFFYWFFIFVGYFKMAALFILPFYIANELYQFYQSPDSGVAFMAHAGGFVAGSLVIVLSRLLTPNFINNSYIEDDQTLSPYQKALAEVYELMEKYRFKEAGSRIDDIIKNHGSHFELTALRYQLLKIDKGDDYLPAATSLLTTQGTSKKQLETLQAVWQENADLHDQLKPDDLVKLAMALTQLPDPHTADAIFQQLFASQYRDTSLSILAKKLSHAYGNIQQPSKKNYFEKIADDLLVGNH